jgi:CPA2 family monovalent cation:H+ antiporter-2
MLNPLLYPYVGGMEAWLKAHPALWRILNRKAPQDAEVSESSGAAHRAVVVGHGPTGEAVVRLLCARGIEATVIEMNITTHNTLRGAGIHSVYGDANQREVLEHAGVVHAEAMILTSSGSAEFHEAIRIARELNKGIHIVARADYLRQAAALRAAGADEVFSGEGEVALAMAQSILRDLGATNEQLLEESAKLRRALQAAPDTRRH